MESPPGNTDKWKYKGEEHYRSVGNYKHICMYKSASFCIQNGGNKIIYLYWSVSMDIWKSAFVYLERHQKNKKTSMSGYL